MKPILLLNSAMMPAEGDYTLRRLTEDEFAAAVREAGARLISHIGYQETAEHIARLSGRPIPVSRATCVMVDGTEMLICRLNYRVPPGQKGAPQAPPADAWLYYRATFRALPAARGWWSVGIVLLRQGAITEEQLRAAYDTQDQTGCRFPDALRAVGVPDDVIDAAWEEAREP